MGFWELLEDVAEVKDKVDGVRDDGYGVVGHVIDLHDKAVSMKKLHDRMDKLGKEEEKPSTVRFLYELGCHFLGD